MKPCAARGAPSCPPCALERGALCVDVLIRGLRPVEVLGGRLGVSFVLFLLVLWCRGLFIFE